MATFTDLITLIGEKRNRMAVLESEAETKVNELNGHKSGMIAIAKLNIESHTKANERFLSIVKSNQAKIIVLEKKLQELVAGFDREFARELVFNDQDFCCSDTDKLESKQAEMTERFNRAKAEIIEGVRSKGKAVKAQIDELTEANRGLQLRIDDNNRLNLNDQAEINELEAIPTSPVTKESILAADTEYSALKESVALLTAEYNAAIKNDLGY
ncbi:MAG: hypothetical protein R6U11_03795 [Bacteroidales bacterium]